MKNIKIIAGILILTSTPLVLSAFNGNEKPQIWMFFLVTMGFGIALAALTLQVIANRKINK